MHDRAATIPGPIPRRGKVNGRVVLLAAALAAVGLIIWRQTAPTRRPPEDVFQSALSALLENRDPALVADAEERLRDVPGYEQQRMLLRGGSLLRSGRPRQAMAYFDELKPHSGTEAPARLLTGECLYRLGRFGEAQLCLGPLLEDADHAAGARRIMAGIAYDLGANNAALEHLHHLVRLEPDDYRPYRLAGRIYQDFSQFPPAVEYYRKALDRDPPPDVRRSIVEELARTLIELRLYPDCVELLETADETPAALALHATCLLHLGDLDRARELLDAAGRIEPENVDLRRARARLLLDEGDDAAALEVLEGLVEERPADYPLRYELALALGRSGDQAAAEMELARAAELRAAYDRLSELSNAAVLRPDDADVRKELADLCRQLGKDELADVWDRAAAALRAAAPTPPDSPSAARP